mmetsp:Transcript_22833/g.38268  ORF Transcript_22833/g.38268 Transcript_22833/m.38268 type:complete len:107 (-) Transcript_22833:449-769(-)
MLACCATPARRGVLKSGAASAALDAVCGCTFMSSSGVHARALDLTSYHSSFFDEIGLRATTGPGPLQKVKSEPSWKRARVRESLQRSGDHQPVCSFTLDDPTQCHS